MFDISFSLRNNQKHTFFDNNVTLRTCFPKPPQTYLLHSRLKPQQYQYEYSAREHVAVLTCLRDAFDVLYAEGDPNGLNRPKMLSIGMHCRLLGRPGRLRALQKFLDHIQSHDKVWVCRRIDIARHWRAHHPHQVTA